MATYSWSVPTGNIITGNTYIKDTDNKIQDTIDDLADFVNSSGSYANQGLMFDYVNKASNQTITGVKTFSNGLIGNVTGNVTGTVSGNSGTATKLATARTITLAGDVTGSLSFDGSDNTSMIATIADNSHSHTIANVTGLETALDGKLSTSGNATTATKLQTARTISVSGDIIGSITFDGSSNVNMSVEVANDSHTHDTRYYTETEVDILLYNSLSPLVGMVIATARTSAPSGFLECNGALISRVTYSNLFNAIGVTYGVGDGSTTFQLPDLRGEFIRGWDHGRGVDTSRTLGSSQADDYKSHTHTGSTDSTGAHAHGISAGDTSGSSGVAWGGSTTSRGTGSAGAHSHTVTITASGSTETRPRNIAMMYCIKY